VKLKEYEITNAKRRKINNPALEELFKKYGMSWNQKEFEKE
ncbi:759_t:CDS:2, partial [Racocetra persica]